MHREINLDSVRALESQIDEHAKAIIRLKRARNSLLNVSTLLPPEVLGNIFRWNVIPDGDFGGLSKSSYNFLLVCHHWFEVASRTPGLWSFWGNSVRDWAHRHARHRTAPLDLVLAPPPWNGRELDDGLRDALQDRAARDTIRRVHLRGDLDLASKLINSVISSIITKGEKPQSSNVESFIVVNSSSSMTVDISAFFSRYHFPKLRCLRLYGCKISSWDLVESRTMALTTLNLATRGLSPTPTLPQLLSILSSNPLLQDLTLSCGSSPHIADSDKSPPPVFLRHLKKFQLISGFARAFWLLDRLECPDKIDSLRLFLDGCSASFLPHNLGPYLGNLVRRRGRFPGGGLGLSASCSSATFHIQMGDARKGDDSTEVGWFVDVSAAMNPLVEDGEEDRLCLDLIAHIPLEQIIYLQTALPILYSEELCVKMRDLAYLHLPDVDLSTWFAEPDPCGPYTREELLPSLDHILITSPIVYDDWSPLTAFLSFRAAVGNQISLLRLCDHPRMDGNVAESIKRVVEVFEFEFEDSDVEDSDED